MFKRIFTLAVVLLVLAGPITNPTLGLTEQDTALDADHKTFAYDPMFDSVVRMRVRFGSSWYTSSGFYLGNGWFGHTGHQYFNESGAPADEVRFYSGRDSVNYDNMWVADKTDLHDAYTGITGTGKDFGMSQVSGVVDLPALVRSYTAPVRGMEYAFAGFGRYGTASNPNQGQDYQMRAGKNVAEKFGGDSPYFNVEPQYMLAVFDPPGPFDVPLEAHGAYGSSGSEVLWNLNGDYLGGGVMTAVRGDFGYFAQSIILPFTEVNDFIDVRVPEPSTLGFLFAGLVLIGRRRTRFRGSGR
ncbi:MAG: PEP-CTERM sorting domain-containing protein [Phycisphaerae bacterium]|nr:PEP-CTERM sorting domain-containing protein [Phycisphaerae bacterium]